MSLLKPRGKVRKISIIIPRSSFIPTPIVKSALLLYNNLIGVGKKDRRKKKKQRMGTKINIF